MQIMYDFSQFLQSAVTDICRTGSWDNYEKAIKSKKVAGRRLIASSASNFNIIYGSYYQSNLRFKTVEKP